MAQSKTDEKTGEGKKVRGRPTPCPYCHKLFSRSDAIRPHVLAIHPKKKVPIRVTSSPVVPLMTVSMPSVLSILPATRLKKKSEKKPAIRTNANDISNFGDHPPGCSQL